MCSAAHLHPSPAPPARDEEEPVAHLDTDHLDELGKTTLESEEACHSLIAELEHRLEASPDDVSLLWRLARCLIHLSMHCDQKGRAEEEKQLLVKGELWCVCLLEVLASGLCCVAVEHAQRALELDNTVWQSHQWYAIALGSQVKHEGVQKKITAGHQYRVGLFSLSLSLPPPPPPLSLPPLLSLTPSLPLLPPPSPPSFPLPPLPPSHHSRSQEHIDIAISINPDSADLYHLRGRWCYEVAGLSWLEKKAAGALYATPPEATYDEALGDFMKVEELRPDTWKANLLYVGKVREACPHPTTLVCYC